TVTLNGQVLEVVGVAPRGFNGFGGPPTDLWLPTSLEVLIGELSNYTLLGRLSSNLSAMKAVELITPVVREVSDSISAGSIPGYEKYGYSPEITRVMLVPAGYGSVGPEIDRNLVAKQVGL